MSDHIVDGWAYFSASFRYNNPWVYRHISAPGFHMSIGGSCVEDEAANRACLLASRYAKRALHSLGWEDKHEYSWPDGSCYRTFRVPGSPDLEDLKRRLEEKLELFNGFYRKMKGLDLHVNHIDRARPRRISRSGPGYSLHESYTLSREQCWEIGDERKAREDLRLEALVQEYGGDRGRAVRELWGTDIAP